MLDRKIAPQTSSFKDISFPSPQVVSLKNGTNIIIFSQNNIDVVKIDLVFTGGNIECNSQWTLPSMLRMIREGSSQYNAEEIAKQLDFLGSSLNFSAQDHHSIISIKSTNRNLPDTLSLINNVIFSPIFPEDKLEIIKQRSIEDLKNMAQQVRFLAFQKFSEIIYGKNHPLGKEITPEIIAAFTANELREIHKKLIVQPSSIILSGNITQDVISSIIKIFENNNKLNDNIIRNYSTNSLCSNQFTIVNKKDAVQSCIMLGRKAPNRSEIDYIPLRIVTTLLGGYFGSRLMKNLREDKGYTYGISAGLVGKYDSAHMMIITDCDTKYAYKSISEIKKELDILTKEKVEDTELNILKNYMLSDLVKSTENSFISADYTNTLITTNAPDKYFENQVNEIKNITPDKILKIANKYLKYDDFFIVIAGDENKLKKINNEH